jgi:8-oxo-dGTP diphosphatase
MTLSKDAQKATGNIRVAADAVIFTVKDDALQVLLIQMKKAPFTGFWAMPGGELEAGETSRVAALRILREQTGVGRAYLEQLETFDEPGRDPLGRVVSVAWFALVPEDTALLATTEKYAAVAWWPVAKLPKLAYDHAHILEVAVSRVRAKLGYSNVAWSLLPAEFTISRLQDAYEAILDQPLDKRNFTKKILALDMIEPTGRKEDGAAHRPGALYRFRSRKLDYFPIL